MTKAELELLVKQLEKENAELKQGVVQLNEQLATAKLAKQLADDRSDRVYSYKKERDVVIKYLIKELSGCETWINKSAL